MKKLVPNPEHEQALYSVGFIVHGVLKDMPKIDIRTNNPNWLTEGCKQSEVIPSHIEVDA